MSIEESMNTLSAALNRHADVLEATVAATQGSPVKTTEKAAATTSTSTEPTAAEIKKQKAADVKAAKAAKAAEVAEAKRVADEEAAALLDDDGDDTPAITKDMLTALVKDCIKAGKQVEAIAVIKDKGYAKLSAVPESDYPEIHAGILAVKEG